MKFTEFDYLANRLERLLLDASDVKDTDDLRPAADALIVIAARWNVRNRRLAEKEDA